MKRFDRPENEYIEIGRESIRNRVSFTEAMAASRRALERGSSGS